VSFILYYVYPKHGRRVAVTGALWWRGMLGL
jgi:hypothetical protein